MAGQADFEKLVEQHYAGLYRFALSLTGQESEACDLTQQAFYIWARKGHQLQNPSKAKSWLFTTLHREFLLGQRRRTRFPHQPLTEEALTPCEPEAVARLDGATMVELLGKIEASYQAPLALFYLEDYSYREIAEILEIPLGTVKSRIARGMAHLQGLLQREAHSNKGDA
jgi:RNA polymerase sigma-70 factor (ECF subfamily)